MSRHSGVVVAAGWLVTQLALAVLGLMLAGVGHQPDALWVVGALALAIAACVSDSGHRVDAYTVEVLSREEQGAAVGAKDRPLSRRSTRWWRSNHLCGTVRLARRERTAGGHLRADADPDLESARTPSRGAGAAKLARSGLATVPRVPRTSSRHGNPRVRPSAYRLPISSPRLSLVHFSSTWGYSAYHRGIALASISVAATIAGAFVGGWVTTLAGLGHSLWVFGVLQVFSNLGYFMLSRLPAPNIPFVVRRCRFRAFYFRPWHRRLLGPADPAHAKRFSATQYALFSSLFALPRVLAGPISGFAGRCRRLAGIFLSTMVLGIPGLMMLARFVPIGVREPEFTVEEIPRTRIPASSSSLAVRGVTAGLLVGVGSVALVAFLDALKTMREVPAGDSGSRLRLPRCGITAGAADWLTTAWHRRIRRHRGTVRCCSGCSENTESLA